MRFHLRKWYKEATQYQSQIEYELVRYPRMPDMLYIDNEWFRDFHSPW